MEFRTKEIDIIKNRTVNSDELQMFCDEITQSDASKVGKRICQEVIAVVKVQQIQTISWSQILVYITTPVFIDKLVFHELGKVVSLDRRQILFDEIHLIRRVNQQDLETRYSDSAFWRDWKSEKQANDEYWEYEKSYGPPEWGIGVGITLIRGGQITKYHQTDCSF